MQIQLQLHLYIDCTLKSINCVQVRDYGFLRAKPKVTMYSFGQPRVGNGPFAKTYGKLTFTQAVSCRVTISMDVYPQLLAVGKPAFRL